ncbi:M48 family metallopeptidase [Candidatus Halobeggiatoa sp. HSG11]|nr:M48 family metallopeptidase [Candidatus Halobeggiatoa sp. HSG11]
MLITGYWYPTDSSARHDAELHTDDGIHYTLTIKDNDDLQGMIGNISVSDRLGNIPRKITLEDWSIFETQHNDEVDFILKETGHKDNSLHFLHILETNLLWIATAFVLTVVICFSGFYWGLPWASKKIAYAMPIGVHEQISEGTFDLLDKYILEPSELSETRQQSIQEHFAETLLSVQSEQFNYRLYFRQLKDIPNAFALPSGQIIITDKLIEMTDNQQEIDSVLLHEIGHVVHRHGLQQVIHGSIVTIAITMFVGDATAVEEIIVALPTFLLESHYSRSSESEADEYAFKQMVKLGIDPINFATMFEKMTESENRSKKADDSDEEGYGEFLSTHPSSPSRMQKAREYSAKYFNSEQH